MNVKRFTARTSREALRLVREALGDDAVVLSTKPAAGGVEVAGDGAREHRASLEAMSAERAGRPLPTPAPRAADARRDERRRRTPTRLSMSTLSFQDYVRTRMLKRRQASLRRGADGRRRRATRRSRRRSDRAERRSPAAGRRARSERRHAARRPPRRRSPCEPETSQPAQTPAGAPPRRRAPARRDRSPSTDDALRRDAGAARRAARR